MTLPIQTLRSRIQAEIAQLERQINQPNGGQSIIQMRCSINSLNGIEQRLKRIEHLLNIPQYDLVFIGKIGVGKTTAICHLFDLILEEEKAIGRSEKTIRKSSEVLSTGSGRTTIGEVILKPSRQADCYLEIVPYEIAQLETFIAETCTYFWHKAHSIQTDVAPEVPPAELLRAIRNMTNLRETRVEGRMIDSAIALATEYSTLDDFIDAVIDRADLDERTKTQLNAPPEFATVSEEKRWLKTAFAQLNLGKAAGYSLPKKIVVHLGHRLLNLPPNSKIGSVIDTRGLDGADNRADLAEYIRGRDNAICLLAESFISAPSSMSELLKQHLTIESRDLDTKLALLVLTQKGEAEDVVGADGTVEDKAEGMVVRAHQIQEALARDNLKFLEQNIFFFDALQFYDEERILKSYYSSEDVKSARLAVLDEFEQVIQRREQLLIEEVLNYESLFEQIKVGGILSQNDADLVTNLKKKIEQHRSLNFRCNFVDRYLESLASYHASTFRAINRRYGIYELRDIDIYFTAKTISTQLIRERLTIEKENIAGAIVFAGGHASPASGLQPVMQILREQVDDFLEITVDQAAEEFAEIVYDCFTPLSEHNEFWHYAQSRWGRGSGYREDVLERYSTQIQACNNALAECVQAVWSEEFMQKLLAFFEKN